LAARPTYARTLGA
jgi:outer membrane protein assembly factor BamB